MYVHVLVLRCIGFVVCMYVRSSAEERPCRALELKSINQSMGMVDVDVRVSSHLNGFGLLVQ